MFKSDEKSSNDIGGPRFSRVRRYNDQERKARIFDPKAETSVDVSKLEHQVREKQAMKKNAEDDWKKYEELRAKQIYKLNKAEEELRDQRIAQRLELEEFWKQQDKEHKERWKKSKDREYNDETNLFPTSRYKQQDQEPTRGAENRSACDNERFLQLQALHLKRQNELEANLEYEQQRLNAILRLNERNNEIESKRREERVELKDEYWDARQKKVEREKKMHEEEHKYEIPRVFFDQFGTTSR